MPRVEAAAQRDRCGRRSRRRPRRPRPRPRLRRPEPAGAVDEPSQFPLPADHRKIRVHGDGHGDSPPLVIRANNTIGDARSAACTDVRDGASLHQLRRPGGRRRVAWTPHSVRGPGSESSAKPARSPVVAGEGGWSSTVMELWTRAVSVVRRRRARLGLAGRAEIRRAPCASPCTPRARSGDQGLRRAQGGRVAAAYVLGHRAFVSGEGALVVAARSRQLPGEDVRADDGQGGAAADGRAGAVPRVADERHPSACPGVHAELGDGVEVERRGAAELLQPAIHVGAQAGERTAQQLLLPG